MILAIDPGNILSAWVLLDSDYHPVDFGITENNELVLRLRAGKIINIADVVIEMIASYGMPVGATVFDTCRWIGRFEEAGEALCYHNEAHLVYRADVKMNLCKNMRAKDSNIRQALIDRFGVVGTKKNPGWFYGFKKDIWSAYAVGVTWLDMKNKRI